LIRISEKSEEPDLAEFRRRVGRIIVDSGHVGVQRLNVGMTLFQGSKIAGECGLYVPGELTLLGKTLLQLEDIGKCLDPTFDPNAYIRRNVHELVSQRMKKQSTASSVVGSLLDIKEFAAGLPGRLNKLMDTVGNNEIEIKVRTVDVNKVIEGLQTIANRITTGLVLAALIMGASILMQIQTSFRIFGYPGLAILLFLAAATRGHLAHRVGVHSGPAQSEEVSPLPPFFACNRLALGV
jgi:predicted unusual protein kinase regulating ubiquinone biosynthesis (AarF/ABC1/UbiB family)